MLKNMSSYGSLDARLDELSRQLNQKDAELDQQLDEITEATFDEIYQEIERDIETTREGLRRRVEAVKNKPKYKASKEAESALNAMEEDLSRGDLDSAHINRWIPNQWLKVSK
jgi:F0F1-type ATP synthase membrane subunit b/b'